MGDASLPSSFQEELINLKRLIESLETTSTDNTTDDGKNSILNSILEKVEGCFDDCENFVQESKRYGFHAVLKIATCQKKNCRTSVVLHAILPLKPFSISS